jgi:hypothetical protein
MKIKDLDKIEIGDFISTSTGPVKLWWEVVEKQNFGVWVREKEGYSHSFVDVCFVTKHMKKKEIKKS